MHAPLTKHWSLEEFQERRRFARLTTYEPLLTVGGAVIAGVVVDRYASAGVWQLVTAALAWLVWLRLWRAGRESLAAVALLASVALVSGAWHHARWRLFPADDLGLFARAESRPLCFEAVALETPARRAMPPRSPYRAIPGSESSVVELRVEGLRDACVWRDAGGRCRLFVEGHLLGVRAGDRVRVFGQLSAPRAAMNPGQMDFALDARAERRLSLVRAESPDCVSVVTRGRRWAPIRLIDRARAAIEHTLLRRLGPERGALAAAMVVGARERLPRTLVDRFRRTGALHVLVVSGLHVGLVISAFYFAARLGLAPRRWSMLVVMLAIIGYAAVTGARPPVIRAAVLGVLMCVAVGSGRRALALNSLGAAAVLVLAINPCELFRAGAQLSFLAAATLIWFGGRDLERRSNTDAMTRVLRSVEPSWVRAGRAVGRWAWLLLAATLAVWLVSAPLLALRFHLLSPIAIPLALVVFPLVGVCVVGGTTLIMLEALAPWLSAPAAVVTGAAVEWLQAAIEAADRAPGAHFYLPGPSLWWVLGAYVMMAVGLKWGGLAIVRRALVRLWLAWAAAAFAPLLWQNAGPPRLTCTFLSVGHGACVVIQPPGGGALLYDAGSLGSPRVAAETIAAALWSKGIVRLDGVVLSHADIDHFNAMPGLLERFDIRNVYVAHPMFPGEPRPDDRGAPAQLQRLLAARGVRVHRLELGDRLRMGDARAEVLHPTRLGVWELDSDGGDNANSLVLGVEFAGQRVMLPGDLEGRGLEEVTRQEPYDCDVLMAPHHGSPRSDPPGFAAWCTPECVVISSGDGPTASASYRTAGARVTTTATAGAVEVRVGAGSLAVRPLRDQG